MTASVTFSDIEDAAKRIGQDVPPTPTVAAGRLSERLGAEALLKLETQHLTGSFKERGALNRLLALSEAERHAGVVAMSAGNHAQAVARHATRLGVRATIVMPKDTPFTKVERTRALGARVVTIGETLSEARDHAARLVDEQGAILIHPYDDPLIIAGQGTVGLEFMAQAAGLDDLIVPIGGGGLIAGTAIAAKTINPKIKITGAQCALYPSMIAHLQGWEAKLGGPTLAEGIAVKAPGALTSAIIRDWVDDLVIVDEPALELAVHLLATTQKVVAEGAGAASLAAALSFPDRFQGRRIGLVVSGGNIDARVLAQVLTRGLVMEGRLVRLRVAITDQPGTLAKVTGALAECGANIVEIEHRRLFHDVPIKMADVDVVVETRDRAHVDEIIAMLTATGFPTELMADIN